MRLQMLKKLIFTYLYINKVGIEVDFRNAKKEESFPILFNLFILFWGEGGYPPPLPPIKPWSLMTLESHCQI